MGGLEDIGLIPRKILLAMPNQAWPLRRPAEARRQTGRIGEPSSSLVLFTNFVQDAHAIELLQELRCNCDGSAEAPFERRGAVLRRHPPIPLVSL